MLTGLVGRQSYNFTKCFFTNFFNNYEKEILEGPYQNDHFNYKNLDIQ